MSDDKTITVPLLKAGVSSRTGFDYSEAFEMFDFDATIKKRRGMLFGEHEMPKVTLPFKATQDSNKIVREEKEILVKHSDHSQLHRQVARILTINLQNVSHVITNIRVEDGVLVGDAKATGVYGALFEKLHDMGKLHFGMRGFVELDGMKVKKIREIVTFDLVSAPL